MNFGCVNGVDVGGIESSNETVRKAALGGASGWVVDHCTAEKESFIEGVDVGSEGREARMQKDMRSQVSLCRPNDQLTPIFLSVFPTRRISCDLET